MDAALIPHVSDAITLLSNEWVWKQVGDEVGDIVDACKDIVESWYSDMLIGAVFPWVMNPPSGWLLLDGSTYASTDYPELFAVLPSHLISGSNFTLPDVANSFPYGVQDEDDGSLVEGSNDLTLTIAQLPVHTHDYIPSPIGVSPGGAGPPIPSAAPSTPIPTTSTGSGDNIDKRPQRFGLVYAVFTGR